jgi:acetyl esterase/lipase
MSKETATTLGGHLPAEPRTLTTGVRLFKGIEYATIRGFRPLLLDLYLPASAGPWPAVVFLHGGGWGVGTRASMAPPLDDWSPSAFERIAAAGLALATVDYRLTGEAIFPAQLHDAKAAVRWLRSEAGALGIDGERIVAWGASAGGHLAALLGLTGGHAELEGEVGVTGVSSAVCAVIDWYGPTDLVSMESQSDGTGPMEHDSASSPEGSLIGGVVSELPERARDASPISYVHRVAPPFQIKHGGADKAVPRAQSQSLALALAQAGVRAELELIDGADHMWIGAEDVEAIFESSLAFALDVAAQ